MLRREVVVKELQKPRVEEILERILEIFEENFPTPEDEQLYAVETLNVPALSEMTVIWIVERGWIGYLKKLYADAVPETTYEWRIPFRDIVFRGNEIPFYKPLRIPELAEVILKITNESIETQDIDILIVGWARKIRGRGVETW